MRQGTDDDRAARFWRVRGLRDLELLHATHETRAIPRRLHEGFEISVVESGTQKLCYRGSTHLAVAGSVVVINPGEVHSSEAADKTGWTYRAFYPTDADMRDAASTAVGKRLPTPSFSTPVIQDRHVASILRELHRLLELPNAALAQESYSIWVAAQLVTRHADSRVARKAVGQEHRAVRIARDFIEANYAENINLAQITSLTSLSSFHLIRVFTREIGMPPHAYLNQVRVNRARRLLAQQRSISRVATETGFVDQSHLSRHFKRIMGMTPGQYAHP